MTIVTLARTRVASLSGSPFESTSRASDRCAYQPAFRACIVRHWLPICLASRTPHDAWGLQPRTPLLRVGHLVFCHNSILDNVVYKHLFPRDRQMVTIILFIQYYVPHCGPCDKLFIGHLPIHGYDLPLVLDIMCLAELIELISQ